MAYTDIDKSDDYFNTKLYTGNGGTQSITGVNFKPDFVWLKNRDNGAYFHQAYDIIRGATKRLHPDSTDSEATLSNGLTAFNSDGFSVGSDGGVNNSGEKFVSWNWLASNTTGSNTDGSITSTVSANTTSGFSIVSYTGNATSGATVGHGLGVAPKMLIAKNRTTGGTNWGVWHTGIPINEHLILNGAQASSVYTGFFNNTLPSTSVVTLGNDVVTNGSGNNIILYCFAEKKGFSKFNTYTGNGSADGTFVYTGFKPAWIMIKDKDSAFSWHIYDNKRLGYNVDNNNLYANTSGAEETSDKIDILSNGFKLRTTDVAVNENGSPYIYLAFAENPFVTSTGIPACAR